MGDEIQQHMSALHPCTMMSIRMAAHHLYIMKCAPSFPHACMQVANDPSAVHALLAAALRADGSPTSSPSGSTKSTAGATNQHSTQQQPTTPKQRSSTTAPEQAVHSPPHVATSVDPNQVPTPRRPHAGRGLVSSTDEGAVHQALYGEVEAADHHSGGESNVEGCLSSGPAALYTLHPTPAVGATASNASNIASNRDTSQAGSGNGNSTLPGGVVRDASILPPPPPQQQQRKRTGPHPWTGRTGPHPAAYAAPRDAPAPASRCIRQVPGSNASMQ